MSSKITQLPSNLASHIDINKVYEDSSLLILDKPSGITVNRSSTSNSFTLQDYVEANSLVELPETANEYTSRSGIIHRLDKDTSGLIMIAKDPDSYAYYQNEFRLRNIKKTYAAVVFGHIAEDNVEIDAPISRDQKNRTKFAVSKDGREAVTLIEKVNEFDLDGKLITSLYVYPKTGRTHQIRVHLTALGHPILGDVIYSGKKRYIWASDNSSFGRLMLHAKSLKFKKIHSSDVIFVDSTLPKEFSPFFAVDG